MELWRRQGEAIEAAVIELSVPGRKGVINLVRRGGRGSPSHTKTKTQRTPEGREMPLIMSQSDLHHLHTGPTGRIRSNYLGCSAHPLPTLCAFWRLRGFYQWETDCEKIAVSDIGRKLEVVCPLSFFGTLPLSMNNGKLYLFNLTLVSIDSLFLAIYRTCLFIFVLSFPPGCTTQASA